MPQLRSKALRSAQIFIGTEQPLTLLGWGVSGFVFLTPDAQSAIKVHHQIEAHLTEVSAYQLLKQHGITALHGLTIPELRNFDSSLRLIQIDVVKPPYLLDFAGVKFSDPQFSADTLADIHATIAERFGPNAHIAYDVYDSLLDLGMYYLDLRQSNLNLDGLPGLKVEDQTEQD